MLPISPALLLPALALPWQRKAWRPDADWPVSLAPLPGLRRWVTSSPRPLKDSVMSELITYHAEDGIATLTLNNGKVNAISPDVIDAFNAALDQIGRAHV